ncbi:NUDIX domain-containing protein [Streptomyces sp. R11]|uniref:NUDIX domain-containing protein n=1 Tax=Streptomyces sp. R11 TaxID=3238625 RepID=A0AB39MWR0_9ACTN
MNKIEVRVLGWIGVRSCSHALASEGERLVLEIRPVTDLPGGLVDEDEKPVDAARRELAWCGWTWRSADTRKAL